MSSRFTTRSILPLLAVTALSTSIAVWPAGSHKSSSAAILPTVQGFVVERQTITAAQQRRSRSLASSLKVGVVRQDQANGSASSSSSYEATTTRTKKTRSRSSTTASSSKHPHQHQHKFRHAMAVLAMPYTAIDRIANEAILNTILPQTDKLSVVLRCQSPEPPSLARLRRYVGEIYSQLWDCVMNDAEPDPDDSEQQLPPVFHLPDIVVYPQNLPNTAPEAWIEIQPDLQAVCSHNDLMGWVSEEATGRGCNFQHTQGVGGLQAHVQALNADRRARKLQPIQAVPVSPQHWPSMTNAADAEQVLFVDDEVEDKCQSPLWQAWQQQQKQKQAAKMGSNGAAQAVETNDDECDVDQLLGGARIPADQQVLYDSVCCGGTFDGLHFGHRKLLTLAVSSVTPVTGRLLVGVTVDRMLRKKKFAQYIPSLEERCEGVRNFIHQLAPGMMNRVQIVPIADSFGPPGKPGCDFFDALVLSHETLETGYQLNRYRKETLGLPPLKLLCLRRTEAHGMSSTTLRRLRRQQVEQLKLKKQKQQEQAAAGNRDDDKKVYL